MADVPALLALFGPKRGLRIPLVGPIVVGRGAGVDLQLVDGKVSREHCRIEAGAEIRIEDLGSQNGTYVNGAVIAGPTPLHEGDEIAVGDTLLLLAGDEIDVRHARYGEGTLVVEPGAPAGGQPAFVAWGEVGPAGLTGAAVELAKPAGAGSESAGPVEAAIELAKPAGAGSESAGSVRGAVELPGVRGLGELAAGLAAAAGEEDAAAVLLDAVEAELQPRRASLLVRLAGPHGPRIVPLATRGCAALASVSRTLLGLADTARRGVLVADTAEHRELRGARSVVLHSLRSVIVAPWGGGGEGPRGYLLADRERPFGPAELAWLEAAAGMAALRLDERHPVAPPPGPPVGASPTFLAAVRLADAAARVDSTVLLLGETGTGKEEIARLIHARSRRAAGPFVAVNCGAIAEALAESELFGHEKGAFTGAAATRVGAFEAADGGTLFLDEIGDLPAPLQVKLLRVLQERAVVRVGSSVTRSIDVRVLAATHRPLRDEVKAGRFREDLYFRLDVLGIALPPLRERRDDIPLLAGVLVARIAARLGLRAPELGADGLAALAAWDFPGNVRELGNVLERILVLRDPHQLGPVDRDDVAAALGREMRGGEPAVPVAGEGTLAEAVARLERASIASALRRARGVKSHAARLLGISRPTLDKKIGEMAIDVWK